MSVSLLAALLFSAVLQAQPNQITVENAYVRGLPPSQRNTAAFFSVQNHRDQDIQIVAGVSDAAEDLEIHGHKHRNGMMLMQREDSITVPAGGEFVFAPGAYHLMLINLTQPLADGDRVQFTLKTDGGEIIAIDAPVVSVLKSAPSKSTSSSNMSSTEHTGMH